MVLVMVTAASASFGSFASDSERTVDGTTASFGIKIFNLGEEPLNIEVNAESPEGADLIYPETYRVAPSKATKNPSDGSNWFYLGDGKYVKTVKIPVTLQKNPQSSKNTFKFDVNIQGTTSNDDNRPQDRAFHKVQQVRTYTFKAITGPSSDSVPNQNQVFTVQDDINSLSKNLKPLETVQRTVNSLNPLKDSSNSESGSRNSYDVETLTGSEENEEPKRNQKSSITDQQSSSTSDPSDKPKSSQTGQKTTGNFFGAGTSMTAMLIAGITITMLYLVRVM